MGRSGLTLRLLSAVVLLPIILLLLWVGGWWFYGLVAVTMCVATWEGVRLLRRLEYRPALLPAAALVCAILLVFQLGRLDWLAPALAVLLVGSLAWHVVADKTSRQAENWLLSLGPALYLGWTAGHGIALRALPQGAFRAITMLGITWIGDSASYFVGRAWGRHPMAPRLSPKKTWEGYAGGVVGGVVSGTLLLGLGEMGWVHGAVLGLLVTAISPLGDLGVSMLKRQAGVDDASHVIPGHGGVLDRVDSVLIAALIGYYYHAWAMGALPPAWG